MKKYLFILLIVWVVLVSNLVSAATYPAASCSQSDVQSAVNSASAGDTVTVPSCNTTYSSPVTITKAITIQGAGKDSTVINANNSVVFGIHLTSGIARITGFGFTGTGGSNSNNTLNSGLIVISGKENVGIFDYVRVDHCKFTNTNAIADIVIGEFWDLPDIPKVLIDNNIHYGYSSAPFFVKILGSMASWSQPDYYGTDKFVFIEDNTITYTYAGCTTDTEYGARFVGRNNTLNTAPFCTHDNYTYGRGQRLHEIYNNTLTGTGGNASNIGALQSRGGTGVMYNNIITGNYYGWANEISRIVVGGGWLGYNCGEFRKVCSDPVMGISKIPCSSDGDCAGQKCVSIDGDQDAYGWPCRDQTGWGQDDPVTHKNTLSPLYVWNNTFNGSPFNATGYGYANYIKENRDFCNHSPSTACGSKPGWTYTPYPYPYPWPPTGLHAPKNVKASP